MEYLNALSSCYYFEGKLEEALEEIERTVVNGPLKGVCMEPGALDRPCMPTTRASIPSTKSAKSMKSRMILMLGGRAGPDITYSDPKIINRIAADFPRTNFIISHGGWPWVQQILGRVLLPEEHLSVPGHVSLQLLGRGGYIMAANNFMQDRFLFGTATR